MNQPILIVDDNPDVLEIMRLVLEVDGYQVMTALDGETALRCLREGAAPALILLDMMMPRMSGWEFLDEIDRDTSFAAIPIVVLSGAGTALSDVGHNCVVGHLDKPVERTALLSTVRKCAPQARG